jgi:hypothetical protein
MFQFEVLQQLWPVRTEGKNEKKKTRRILDVTAKIYFKHPHNSADSAHK